MILFLTLHTALPLALLSASHLSEMITGNFLAEGVKEVESSRQIFSFDNLAQVINSEESVKAMDNTDNVLDESNISFWKKLKNLGQQARSIPSSTKNLCSSIVNKNGFGKDKFIQIFDNVKENTENLALSMIKVIASLLLDCILFPLAAFWSCYKAAKFSLRFALVEIPSCAAPR